MNSENFRVGLVGPLPPPSGGMANQTRQLASLLAGEGMRVELVQVNAPYRPACVSSLRGLRAVFRFVPYVARLWSLAGRVQLIHVMANSGWSWHLYAAPAIIVARIRNVPVLVNYRGGDAETFFSRSFTSVYATLRFASAVVVPSQFLHRVFANYGVDAMIVPNIIDLARFSRRAERPASGGRHIVVTRNLEPIYDIETALKAFAEVRRHFPDARLTIAGSGPDLARLEQLASTLGVSSFVSFTGRLDNNSMAKLYHSADVMINPSLVDNMPISILEAWASRVPVVTTNVGGIPFLARDGENALMVPPKSPSLLAARVIELFSDPVRAAQLAEAGYVAAQRFAWPNVRERLLHLYRQIIGGNGPRMIERRVG